MNGQGGRHGTENRDYRNGNRGRGTGYTRLAAIVVFVAAAVLLSLFLADRYLPNSKEQPLETYYEDWGNNMIVNGDDQISGYTALDLDGELYLPFEFVKDNIDKYAFWDAHEQRLTLTTATTVTRFSDTGLWYEENGERHELAPGLHISDKPYIPAGFLSERYDIEIAQDITYGAVIFDNKRLERSTAAVKSKKAVMRYEPDIKSFIAQRLVAGEELAVFGAEGDFTRVRSAQGVVGYIKTAELDGEPVSIPPVIEAEPEIVHAKPLTGRVTLLWDQVTNIAANSDPSRRQTIEGVDVLSPTWFSFNQDKPDGTIISIADKAYVDFAHRSGYQVWALITDNFNGDVCHAVTASTSVREYVIEQLTGYVRDFGLDGINIDFEAVRKEDAVNYLQFIRELAPALRGLGAYLSVDMFVPSPWSMYYNRAEVGKAADFICIMAYDEHYSGSPVSGPVASLNFVDSGVADTLDEVPKEKILMGMPFYVRVWREEREEPGGVAKLSIRNYSMEYARSIFTDNNAEFIWLAEIGSYYAEYPATEDGKHITYKVWLEDEYSIEQKLKIAEKYDVAGVACWKRGLEKPDVWAVINKYTTARLKTP